MQGFPDILARRALLDPWRTALVDAGDGTRLTYRDLDRRAGGAAGWLADRGVARGQRVCVLSQNRAAVVEMLFACARIGAILAPLNTRLGAGELRRIVADAGPSLLLHDDPNAARAAGLGVRHEALPDARERAGRQATLPVDADAPWILCYTGGTTGTPKGALLTHGSILWNAMNTICGWGVGRDDVAPVFTPLYHTGGLNVLMTPLVYAGGTSVLVPAFDPGAAFDLIREHSMTYVFMVPSMYRMMMQSPRWEAETFESVREFVTGGAPCPRDIHEAFASKGRRFRSGYGLTEAGPNNFHIDPARALEKHGSVGVALPFVEVMIDGADPRGVGELLIRGPHVFAGYLGRPGETAEVLRDGWLRTGDLARRDADGDHYIVGRLKEMFISGGENVYPAEVEEALLEHPDVRDAAVVGVADERWGEVGLAAVVPAPGSSPAPEALAEFLRGRIAHYKVPRRFVFLDELPRTGAGKTDKRSIEKL